jgi:hypothetical protein
MGTIAMNAAFLALVQHGNKLGDYFLRVLLGLGVGKYMRSIDVV